ncbi:RlpA [Nitrospina gracilis 3/211]|uniref:Probable endolytic peptidoglycan transglycosylase RlpA n=1 Tax=Nitrospina gracilis (strain 3/211) TaxID=1266370 RepID=M1YKT6_NITG3|nr:MULTISPECIES: septal ring lytic transglycosylase RlpA family protein [Nitrospina]MCF8723991.1 rare lipoprotein A [Nitrospina sp. Nb-3]CCQ91116.1 RlpA [Nitrospina gracilis 3/211]
MKHKGRLWVMGAVLMGLSACTVIEGTYQVVKGTVKGVYYIGKNAVKVVYYTGKATYKIGEFTFDVVTAPLDWPLMNDEIDTIDGLPVKEAIRLGRVKNAPYTVKGKKYYPMSVEQAKTYTEVGIASWYGQETYDQDDGHMTANGEAFNPDGLSAAHKFLPLPTNVRVTNLENGRSIIVRVNDRGPFPSAHNPRSGSRIIDLSHGAAKRLGFDGKGTVRVKVETVDL